MTTVAFFSSPQWGLIGFEASGHSGYADAGEDIVCAAVSALTQAVLGGLREVVKAPLMYQIGQENAEITVCLTQECDRSTLERAQILLETLRGALEAIAGQYPRNVRIIFKERRKYTCSA